MAKGGRESSRHMLPGRRGDWLIIGAVALAAAVAFLATRLTARPGVSAVITTPEGEITLDLSREETREFTGRDGLRVVIRVQGNRVRFESSGCPDQVCVHSGWLDKAGQSAACVPAGIALRVSGGSGGVDAVAQ